jgi:hypothetical protein
LQILSQKRSDSMLSFSLASSSLFAFSRRSSFRVLVATCALDAALWTARGLGRPRNGTNGAALVKWVAWQADTAPRASPPFRKSASRRSVSRASELLRSRVFHGRCPWPFAPDLSTRSESKTGACALRPLSWKGLSVGTFLTRWNSRRLDHY